MFQKYTLCVEKCKSCFRCTSYVSEVHVTFWEVHVSCQKYKLCFRRTRCASGRPFWVSSYHDLLQEGHVRISDDQFICQHTMLCCEWPCLISMQPFCFSTCHVVISHCYFKFQNIVALVNVTLWVSNCHCVFHHAVAFFTCLFDGSSCQLSGMSRTHNFAVWSSTSMLFRVLTIRQQLR